MYIDFDQMPKNARIWVYQADRNLTNQEVEEIKALCKDFITSWTAHKQDLKGSFKVFYQRFIVLAVDERYNQVSGCSIDTSVHFIQKLEQNYTIRLLDRTQLAFWVNPHHTLQTTPVKNLKQQIADGLIQGDTIVFNNLVENIEQLHSKWQLTAEKSWLAKYFV